MRSELFIFLLKIVYVTFVEPSFLTRVVKDQKSSFFGYKRSRKLCVCRRRPAPFWVANKGGVLAWLTSLLLSKCGINLVVSAHFSVVFKVSTYIYKQATGFLIS